MDSTSTIQTRSINERTQKKCQCPCAPLLSYRWKKKSRAGLRAINDGTYASISISLKEVVRTQARKKETGSLLGNFNQGGDLLRRRTLDE